MVTEEFLFVCFSLFLLKEKLSFTEFLPLYKINIGFLLQAPITLGIPFHGLSTLMAIP